MWLILSIVASILQTLRNSFQRGLLANTGVWGATWVRFAFGVPVTLVAAIIIAFIMGRGFPFLSREFIVVAIIGAMAQVLATAALLKSMDASSFALGATLQHSSLLITALFGFAFLGDSIGYLAWLGFFLASIGMVISTWPKGSIEKKNLSKTLMGGFWGLVCGALFAVSANAFRKAVLQIAPIPDIFTSCFTVLFVQTVQAIGLGIYLQIFEPSGLRKAIGSWRESLNAGIAGASSSIIWFLALALVPAALPRAVNLVVEAPLALYLGAQKFKERLSKRKIIAIIMIVSGVLLSIFDKF